MILLDTNVVSAVMKPAPVPSVVAWLDRQATHTLFLSTITVAEIGFGLHCLPKGRRRTSLQENFRSFVAQGFGARMVSFDLAAADVYGELMAKRRALGRPMSALDGQIAAIAKVNGCAVATGNTRDFEECGLRILDPFL